MTQLDYYIIERVSHQIKLLKGMFYLTTGQAITVYLFLISSVIIYSINICKRKKVR